MSGASCWEVSRQSAISNAALTVKNGAGHFGGYATIYNPNSSVAYLQVYDESGTITVGTTTPRMTLPIPAGAAANLEIRNRVFFTNTIKIAATTGFTNGIAPLSNLEGNILYV